MEGPLLRLCRWARTLRTDAVPDDVLRVTRLSLVSAAGALRRIAPTAAAARIRAAHPGDTPYATATRDAALLARFAWDDVQLGGRVNLGAVPAALAWAGGHTVDELVLAVVAANEVAGRIGLATLLGPRAHQTGTCAPAVGAAVVIGLLEGASDEQLARRVSGAIGRARRIGLYVPLADVDQDPSRPGRDALDAARYGVDDPGAASLLDEGHPFWSEACVRPLPGALHDEGSAWLTRSLVVSPEPGSFFTQVAGQGLSEILRRHVKAAEKRLRADQVERVEVRVNWLTWALDEASRPLQGPAALLASLPRLIAMRIVFHELTPALCDDGALASRADELAAVASRVAVVHDWGLSFGTVEGATSSLGPLLAGFGPADYRALRGRLKPSGAWPTWTVDELPDAASARPDRIVAALLGKRGTLAQAAVHPYAWQLPVRIKLYTNRGGWWPERRSRPEGTVAGGDLEPVALARFGAGADVLVTATGRADDLVAGLRAG